MNRLFTGIATIALVGVVVAGATVAFYNDTETSTGNVFTAGSIDLKVDHNHAYYNGLECEDGEWDCEPWADHVVDFDQGLRSNGTAVLPERSDPSQALGEPEEDDTYNFVSLGFATGVGGSIILGFDNYILNGSGDDVRVVETSFGNPSESQYPEKAEVYASLNGTDWEYLGLAQLDESFDLGSLEKARYIKIVDVTNPDDFGGVADGFDVDGVEALHCGTDPSEDAMIGTACNGYWDLKDLGLDDTFFNFGDIKPGDHGKNVISLHVDSNDAWACLLIHDVTDDENYPYEPEQSAGDDASDGIPNGELSQYMNAFAWNDLDGDGYYEPYQSETEYASGSFTGGFTAAIHDSLSGNGVLTATSTEYIGLAWCAGTLNIDPVWGFMSCDGDSVSDVAQSDIMTASLTAFAEQVRNNDTFECANVDLGDGGDTQDNDVYFNGFENNTYGWNDYAGGTLSRVTSGNNGVSSANGAYHAIVEGDYPFTRWGGYSDTFPTGGYTTEIDVYIDMSDVAATSSDPYFEFSSAANGSDGLHQRDFIFHVGHDTLGGNWSATVSNNSTHPSSPQPDTPHLTNQVGGTVTPVAITQSGWYTLQSYFYDNGGVLAVDMNIVNDSGITVASWTLSSPLDTIPAAVGGNRYGWFTQQPFPFLAVDNSRMYLGAPN